MSELPTHYNVDQVRTFLRLLADHINSSTCLYFLPPGTPRWYEILVLDPPQAVTPLPSSAQATAAYHKNVVIPIRIFGVYAGYDIETNRIYIWKE